MIDSGQKFIVKQGTLKKIGRMPSASNLVI